MKTKKTKITFTDPIIRGLKKTGKPYSKGDIGHKGLMVRVSATGSKTFALAYHSKTEQKTRFLTFGQYPSITLADAISSYRVAMAAISLGEDPQAKKVEDRASKKSALTYGELVTEFVDKKLRSQRTAHDRELRLHRTGRRFGWTEREAISITEDEASACLIKLAEKGYTNERGKLVGGRVEAFATKSLLSEMWRWAKRRKLIALNIFADLEVEEAKKAKRRARVLSAKELRALWAELDRPEELGFSADCATALRLILATTARPGMVCGMMTSELDALDKPQPTPITHGHGQLRDVSEGNGPLWVLPHERMKRKDDDESTEPFIVPLNAMAVDLIGKQDTNAHKRVFGPWKVGGHQLLTPNLLAKFMRAVVMKLGIDRVTPHDLRRTASTLIQSAVLPDRPKYLLEEVGWLLSHRSQDKNGVTGIYGRYEHFDEKRAMSAVLARELTRILKAATELPVRAA